MTCGGLYNCLITEQSVSLFFFASLLSGDFRGPLGLMTLAEFGFVYPFWL